MKIKAILIAASALTLVGAPSAFAQHHHNGGGGGGHHAAQARHSGGSQRARATHARRAATRQTTRRATVRRGATRHTASRRAATRHAAVRGRHTVRRTTTVRTSRVGGAQHWRHATRVGSWNRGSRLPVSYWRSHRWVDWRAHRLWAPPRGYNWVYVNGDYVLLAITTGIIADIVLANSYY